MRELVRKWNEISLVKRIVCGLVVGILLGLAAPQATVLSVLGDLFVGALKAVAPLLVLFLVMGALSRHRGGQAEQYETYHCAVPSGHLCGRVRGGGRQLPLPHHADAGGGNL